MEAGDQTLQQIKLDIILDITYPPNSKFFIYSVTQQIVIESLTCHALFYILEIQQWTKQKSLALMKLTSLVGRDNIQRYASWDNKDYEE